MSYIYIFSVCLVRSDLICWFNCCFVGQRLCYFSRFWYRFFVIFMFYAFASVYKITKGQWAGERREAGRIERNWTNEPERTNEPVRTNELIRTRLYERQRTLNRRCQVLAGGCRPETIREFSLRLRVCVLCVSFYLVTTSIVLIFGYILYRYWLSFLIVILMDLLVFCFLQKTDFKYNEYWILNSEAPPVLRTLPSVWNPFPSRPI